MDKEVLERFNDLCQREQTENGQSTRAEWIAVMTELANEIELASTRIEKAPAFKNVPHAYRRIILGLLDIQRMECKRVCNRLINNNPVDLNPDFGSPRSFLELDKLLSKEFPTDYEHWLLPLENAKKILDAKKCDANVQNNCDAL